MSPTAKLRQEEKRQRQMRVPELPEDCIAHILASTSLRDACISAMVSRNFKSAADSDSVWEKFLSLNYEDIIRRSDPSLNLDKISSKKQLYCRLCTPILIDGGNKSFNLQKNNGKICLMLGSKELTIDGLGGIGWQDTNGRGIALLSLNKVINYWKWISPLHSRFADAIELVESCWLLISGKINTLMLSPKTTYVAYLVLKLTDYAYGFDMEIDIMTLFDYEDDSLEAYADLSVEFVRGEGRASGLRTEWLAKECKVRQNVEYVSHQCDGQFLCKREGGWKEIKLGEFNVDERHDGEIKMSMREMDCGEFEEKLWKVGLIIQDRSVTDESREKEEEEEERKDPPPPYLPIRH